MLRMLEHSPFVEMQEFEAALDNMEADIDAKLPEMQKEFTDVLTGN